MNEIEEATSRTRIASLEGALKVIYTWAGVSGALVPKNVRELIETRMPFSKRDGPETVEATKKAAGTGTIDLRKETSISAKARALKQLAEQHVAVLTKDSHVRVTVHRGCVYINVDGYNVFSVEGEQVDVNATSKAAP